jgi:sucrose-phosphate synthase
MMNIQSDGEEASKQQGLYLVMMSIHGLVRGFDMELGRDADTGGQVKYVVDLARALARNEQVARVDLLTRLIEDPKVDDSYAEPEEDLGDGARIVRLRFGPRRYLRKEVLWPHISSFVDQALRHFRRVGRVPDVIHGHYADAGVAGASLSAALGVPFVQTGHSLGRVKRQRLLDDGMKQETIESRFNISQRIEAEEVALDNALFIVASTQQEVEEQYSLYDHYPPRRMVVIPPGVELAMFRPPGRFAARHPIEDDIDRFLAEPKKPPILALSRADRRKNITALVHAYGQNPELQEAANLVLVAGNRDDITEMDRDPREVLTEILLLIDRYDLHGRVAYPKHHEPDDVPAIYQLAAKRRGVFVNPALTEPFGLTLLEAAASGVPVVATNDGGPKEILARCRNGELIDPLDIAGIATKLLEVVTDKQEWRRRVQRGLTGVRKHFSWDAHAKTYLRVLKQKAGSVRHIEQAPRSKLPTAEKILVTDVDDTLIGDGDATRAFVEILEQNRGRLGLGVATGRTMESTVKILEQWKVPKPDVLITAVGAEIYYGPRYEEDVAWSKYISQYWTGEQVRAVLRDVDGVTLQPQAEQRVNKASFYIDPELAPPLREIRTSLRRRGIRANCIISHSMYLDVLPSRASKGRALRYLANKWGLPFERILTAGCAGNDFEMLTGDTRAVVVGNHTAELKRLKGRENVHFAEGEHAWGIIEGLRHYDFVSQSSGESSGAIEESA